jgi:hypothetical protein
MFGLQDMVVNLTATWLGTSLKSMEDGELGQEPQRGSPRTRQRPRARVFLTTWSCDSPLATGGRRVVSGSLSASEGRFS